MYQLGIPGGPELLIILLLLAIVAFGLLAVVALIGTVVFLLLRSGSEPDESEWETGDEADREPLDSSDGSVASSDRSADDSGESTDSHRTRDR